MMKKNVESEEYDIFENYLAEKVLGIMTMNEENAPAPQSYQYGNTEVHMKLPGKNRHSFSGSETSTSGISSNSDEKEE